MPSLFSLSALVGWGWLVFGVWYRLTHREYASRTRAPAAARALVVLSVVGAAGALSNAVVASLVGARFSLALEHTRLVMVYFLGTLLALGVAWDASLLVARRLVPALGRFDWEGHGFFSLGAWPMLLLALTCYSLILTSNIALVSLTLLREAPAWRDEILFAIEKPLLLWTTGLGLDPTPWDRLYFLCWPGELGAVFVLVLLTRRPGFVLHYCVSFVLLYYVGRFLGVLNPVQGPLFFLAERYEFLAGTMTERAASEISRVLHAEPTSVTPSALLLGGISAMPSLHVGMVSLTAYWLAVARRATLWLGVPWVLGVWCSTVLLGWHYALDGAGGIALAALCVGMTRWAIARFEPTLALSPAAAARAPSA